MLFETCAEKLKVVFVEKFQEYHDIVVSFNLSSSSESN